MKGVPCVGRAVRDWGKSMVDWRRPARRQSLRGANRFLGGRVLALKKRVAVPAGRKSMTVCLVIGGAGFLGSHLVEALVADHHAVRVVDNFTTGKIENLAAVMDSIEFHPGGLRPPGFDFKVARGVELIFHFGEDADPTGQKDLLGTQQILVRRRAGSGAGSCSRPPWRCMATSPSEPRTNRIVLSLFPRVAGPGWPAS